jgi:very-short-patch-repair endonuclease
LLYHKEHKGAQRKNLNLCVPHLHSLAPNARTVCAHRRKLIIKLDGSQHLEQDEYDAERTAFFESKGYRVLRFWNNDVMINLESVLTVIWDTLNEQKAR